MSLLCFTLHRHIALCKFNQQFLFYTILYVFLQVGVAQCGQFSMGKKIDCLTTINLVNLKSNTMKNTLQRYHILCYPT